jgi:predicted NBD/HSP70 family sugar kinase
MILDIGGSHVKVGFSDRSGEIKLPSGHNLTPEKMLRKLQPILRGRSYDYVSVGFPGVVIRGKIVGEPPNLGRGWVGFDFERALHHPTRVVNDAAMQALGSYHGGRMLFLGLGTGLGTALVIDGQLEPMELAHLPYKKGKTYEDYVGEAALKRLGRKKWQKEVFDVTRLLSTALEPEYIVMGGGNVRKLGVLPPLAERGDNRNAVLGGIRLWGPSGTAATTPKPASRRTRSTRRS